MSKKLTSTMGNVKRQNWAVTTVNVLAMAVVVQNVNTTCLWLDHQPEVPEEAKRFKKF